MKKQLLLLSAMSMLSFGAIADHHGDMDTEKHNYVIDTAGAHASIEFKINHLGFSWLRGRFDTFDGSFYYDPEAPEKSTLNVNIDVSSINSNHAERDKHLRNDDFLDVEKYPTAHYKGTYYEVKDETSGVLHGDFTLRGITKHLPIPVRLVGIGEDPWGNERVGFTGDVHFNLKDFGIDYNLGPASETVYLTLDIEGIKQ